LLDDALPHLEEVIASGAAGPDHWVCRALVLDRMGRATDLEEHLSMMDEQVPQLREWLAGQRKAAREPHTGVALEAVSRERP